MYTHIAQHACGIAQHTESCTDPPEAVPALTSYTITPRCKAAYTLMILAAVRTVVRWPSMERPHIFPYTQH